MKYTVILLTFVFFVNISFGQTVKKWKVSDTTLSVVKTKDTLGQNLYFVCHASSVGDSTCLEIIKTYSGDSVPEFAVKKLFVNEKTVVKIDTLGKVYKKDNFFQDEVSVVYTVAYLDKEGKVRTKEKSYETNMKRISKDGWFVIGSGAVAIITTLCILMSETQN